MLDSCVPVLCLHKFGEGRRSSVLSRSNVGFGVVLRQEMVIWEDPSLSYGRSIWAVDYCALRSIDGWSGIRSWGYLSVVSGLLTAEDRRIH